MLDAHGRLHDTAGRFARTGRLRVEATDPGDRPGNNRTGGRAAAAFQPPTPAAEQRANKERLPTRVRALMAIYDKRDRGEPLTRKERDKIEWASPKKIAEQRAKTGDAVVPRAEAASRERSYAYGIYRPGAPGAPRTGIKRTFTGQAIVERGNYREMLIPTPGRPGSLTVHLETRVRRRFDWPTAGRKKRGAAAQLTAPKPTTASTGPHAQFINQLRGSTAAEIRAKTLLMNDSRLRELLAGAGLPLPTKRGRNALLDALTAGLARQ